MTTPFNRATSGLLASLLLYPLLGSGAVVTNPTLTSGAPTANIIDPSGINEEVDVGASGATSQATLEALPGFASIQTFTGFVAKTVNIFSFTDPTLPDFQWTVSGSTASDSGKPRTDSWLNTSGGSAACLHMNLGPNPGDKTQQFEIMIGEWDGTNLGMTTRLPVAIGFTVTSLTTNESARVSFRLGGGASDVVQTVTGVDEGTDGIDAYFGLLSDASHPIISVKIEFKTNTGGLHFAGVDDFGFLVPPIPPKVTVLSIR